MRHTVFQLVRFGLVGTVNTVVDLVVFFALTRPSLFFTTHYLLAAFCSFFVSGIIGFFLHKHISFRHPDRFHHHQLLRFFVAAGAALVINQLITWLIIQADGYDLFAKLLASVSAGLVNYTLQRLWTFKHRSAFPDIH